MNISIRKATKDDWQIVQKLNNEVFEDNAVYDDYLNLKYPFINSGVEHYKKVVAAQEYGTFIAFDDTLPVGHIVSGPKIVDYRNIKAAEIIEFGVSPKYRSMGVGKMLVDEVKKWAKSKRYQSLYVASYSRNNRAISFYQREGFSSIDIGLEVIL